MYVMACALITNPIIVEPTYRYDHIAVDWAKGNKTDNRYKLPVLYHFKSLKLWVQCYTVMVSYHCHILSGRGTCKRNKFKTIRMLLQKLIKYLYIKQEFCCMS